MIEFRYELLHAPAPDTEVQLHEYSDEDFSKAREQFRIFSAANFRNGRVRKGKEGYFPHTELFLREYDEEGEELNSMRLLTDKHRHRQFRRPEPIAASLMEVYNRGMRWFTQDKEGERWYFETEAKALSESHKFEEGIPKIFNLERQLDRLEERSIRLFLRRRPAISTNKVEEICQLGRGTLSKVKNGQRGLSRKHYPAVLQVLSNYGYEPHVDLRLLQERGVEAVMILGEDEEE